MGHRRLRHLRLPGIKIKENFALPRYPAEGKGIQLISASTAPFSSFAMVGIQGELWQLASAALAGPCHCTVGLQPEKRSKIGSVNDLRENGFSVT